MVARSLAIFYWHLLRCMYVNPHEMTNSALFKHIKVCLRCVIALKKPLHLTFFCPLKCRQSLGITRQVTCVTLLLFPSIHHSHNDHGWYFKRQINRNGKPWIYPSCGSDGSNNNVNEIPQNKKKQCLGEIYSPSNVCGNHQTWKKYIIILFQVYAWCIFHNGRPIIEVSV